MTARLAVVTVCLLSTAALGVRALHPERVPPREPLSSLPRQLGSWMGQDTRPFADDVLAVLGVDEYVSRWYREPGEGLVSLYVGYYQSQREGDTIHSPMNCLPGAGWQPVDTGRTTIAVSGRSSPIEVNHVVIQKGLDRQVALYWYQSHGRIVASEYESKLFMVYDAVRLNRSDAALVRVISPIQPSDNGDQTAAERARAFVQALFPALEGHLPS
jgi:EpsI family protein